MIYEYALTPDFVIELLDSKTHVTNFLRVIQYSNAVALSNYPLKLAADVFKKIDENKQNATHPKIKKKWIDRERKADDFFKVIAFDAIKKAKRYNEEQDFELEHTRHPFKKIFTQSLFFDSCENISWLEKEDCSFFTHQSSIHVDRNIRDMLNTLTPILENSNKITFIDPYFYVTSDYTTIYENFFNIIASKTHIRRAKQPQTINIICDSEVKRKPIGSSGAPQLVSEEEFRDSCINTFTSVVPTDLKVNIFRVRKIQQAIHDRFILTNIGGVIIGHGTGIDTNTPPSKTEISLLSRQSLSFWNTIYTPNSPHFDWSEPAIII